MLLCCRHDESPIEVERRRRQLDSGPQIKSTFEQHQSETDITSSTLEQHQRHQRQKRQSETAEESAPPNAPPTELTPEQQRDRRQTTDPDQLCPTVASFVMPRAAVNNQGMTLNTI